MGICFLLYCFLLLYQKIPIEIMRKTFKKPYINVNFGHVNANRASRIQAIGGGVVLSDNTNEILHL